MFFSFYKYYLEMKSYKIYFDGISLLHQLSFPQEEEQLNNLAGSLDGTTTTIRIKLISFFVIKNSFVFMEIDILYLLFK